MEFVCAIILIFSFFPLTQQQEGKMCIDFKQHLDNLNRTLGAAEKTTEESFQNLNNKIQEQKSYFDQQNVNTIYRLQTMMLQQKSMIDDLVDETAVLEDSMKTLNKTFVSQIQNLKQNVKNLKDNFMELNTSFARSSAETDQKFSKIHDELVSLRSRYNQSQQRNREELLSLRSEYNQSQQRNMEKLMELKLRQNKTDEVNEDNFLALAQNQSRLELMLEEQRQLIAKLTEQIDEQNTVLVDGNTTIWQFVKTLSTNQDLTEGQMNQQKTQIQTEIQTLKTALNSEKTQITNSINQFQSTVNSLRTKVTQGPTYCRCSWTGYVNSWDREARFTVSNGQVLAGILSHHHNHYEDRRFRFYVCSLC